MKSVCTLPSSYHHFKGNQAQDTMNISPENFSHGKENPWQSQDLKKLGWSEFMKKKTEETLKTINEEKIHDVRRQRTLARTASAPVSIPKPKQQASKTGSKKELIRVSSTGFSARSEGTGSHSPRISYGRDFLLNCRMSPLCSTPPNDLPVIPGATAPFQRRQRKKLEKTDSNISAASTSSISSNSNENEIKEPKEK